MTTDAPILAAESTITLGNCEARIAAALNAGADTATCPFSGLLPNTGQGCAANVHGTSTIFRDREGQTDACTSVHAPRA